jgi:hypothetical protein
VAKSEIKDNIVIKKPLVGSQAVDQTTGKDPGSKLSNPNVSYFNSDISKLRQVGSELKAIATLARTHGDVSATVSAMVRIANTDMKFRVYDAEHQLSDDGSNLLRSILNRMETQYDYSTGYDNRQSFEGIKTSLLRSIPLTGAVALELVLDKSRLPYALKQANAAELQFVVSKESDGINYKVYPQQTSSEGLIEYNIPTFFYAALDADPANAYPFSPLEPAINTSIFHSEIVQDIRRVTMKSGHSRLVVKLDHENLVKTAPMEVRADSEKLEDWLERTRSSITSQIEALAPESAIITFNNIEVEYLNSQIGASADYTGLMQTIDAILATSLKTPSSILGKPGAGSQNTSSVESLLFLKTASGLHGPVETVLSRALTLAVRLVGFDGYVKCKFSPIDLRPEDELFAFKLMEQQLVLERLSLGFITDQEAAEILGTGPRAPGAPPLSGTMFLTNKGQGNEPPSPNADPARRAMTTDAPKSGGGKDNKQR